ncbi:MAG: VWA domain-containing protein [Nitrososphaerota archaeon]|nr:VWA domain-containing protein [Nitrososphaerota archaeon]MCL5672266.1 VWA domain-containing protein [Nitrososphaerota archaeon]MDG6903588.1 VWA domain-containing protein [Nitrososphaerota archaeon]MDG6912249.1 VWA domain-containing protein [Nitrososphaerota archaeon]MDG6924669.1 VWA domain-containing protein [Nitrososphaerota archaeon]
MSYDESKAKDVLFVIDGSRSMGGKLHSSGMSKMKIVKTGLFNFVAEYWPVSYFPWPIRMGVTFYRLLGTPGSTQIEVVVPLNPAPASLELYRLEDLQCKGGSPLVDAVKYGIENISDSIRKEKVIKLISDGGNDREPIKTISEELKISPVEVDVIELSNEASKELRDIATLTHGTYTRPHNLADFEKAIRS